MDVNVIDGAVNGVARAHRLGRMALAAHAKRADATLCARHGAWDVVIRDGVLVFVEERQWSSVTGQGNDRTCVLLPMTIDH